MHRPAVQPPCPPRYWMSLPLLLLGLLGLPVVGTSCALSDPGPEVDTLGKALIEPIFDEEGSSTGGTTTTTTTTTTTNWTYYQSTYNVTIGEYGGNNGTCNGGGLQVLGCTKGNYNIDFKRGKCEGNPGRKPAWTHKRVVYEGDEWAKAGTKQDHSGVCVTEHPTAGVAIFHDGCTGYPGGWPPKYNQGPKSGWNPDNWGQVFHGACVIHDLCFHAEPDYSGKSKAGCDFQGFERMVSICVRSYKNKWWLGKLNGRKRCLKAAATAWLGMTLGKKIHYESYNYAYDWHEDAICPPVGGYQYRYDIVTGQCEPTSVTVFCGNGVCDSGETASNCEYDCSVCGNGDCDEIEAEEGTCVADCGGCGDGVCGSTENHATCPADCADEASCVAPSDPQCTRCGDGYCNVAAGESQESCPLECHGSCGDGFCNTYAESLSSCPADCQGYHPGGVSLVADLTSNTSTGIAGRSGVYSSSYEAWNAFADTGMWLSNMNTSSVYLDYNWNDGVRRTVNAYEITFTNGSLYQRAPKNFQLQGWTGSSWVTVSQVYLATGWVSGETRSYNVAAPGAYYRYRLLVTADNYNRSYPITLVSIGRLKLLGPDPEAPLVPILTSNNSTGITRRSGVYSASYEAWNAFNEEGMWLSNMNTSSVYLDYEWNDGETRTVRAYEITYTNGSLYQRAPKNFQLQGWTGSSWVTVSQVSNSIGWVSGVTRRFQVSAPGAYHRYRLLVTADNYNRSYPITLVSIGRLQLLGEKNLPVAPVAPPTGGY